MFLSERMPLHYYKVLEEKAPEPKNLGLSRNSSRHKKEPTGPKGGYKTSIDW